MRRNEVQHLSFDRTKPRKTRVRAYVRALEEELRLRRKHTAQFIGTREHHVISSLL